MSNPVETININGVVIELSYEGIPCVRFTGCDGNVVSATTSNKALVHLFRRLQRDAATR